MLAYITTRLTYTPGDAVGLNVELDWFMGDGACKRRPMQDPGALNLEASVLNMGGQAGRFEELAMQMSLFDDEKLAIYSR